MKKNLKKKLKQAKKINGQLIHFGFDESKIDIRPEEYVLGALSGEIINPSSDWSAYLPIYEPQAEKYETWACVPFGATSQIEIILKYLYKKEPNYSERFLYNLVGIEPGGTNPQLIYEAIRKQGLIDQEVLPMPDTFEEFRTPRPMDEKYLAEAKKWLEQYSYKHEWLIKPTKAQILENLKYCPIGIAVTAWFEQNGLYIDNGQPNTHWCIAFNGMETPKGIVLDIFDSYDHSVKKLHPDHYISVAKKILIIKKDPSKPKLSWRELIRRFFGKKAI